MSPYIFLNDYIYRHIHCVKMHTTNTIIQIHYSLMAKCFVSGVRQFWAYVLFLPPISYATLDCSALVPCSTKPSGIVGAVKKKHVKLSYHTQYLVRSDNSVTLLWNALTSLQRDQRGNVISPEYTQGMCFKYFEEWKNEYNWFLILHAPNWYWISL